MQIGSGFRRATEATSVTARPGRWLVMIEQRSSGHGTNMASLIRIYESARHG